MKKTIEIKSKIALDFYNPDFVSNRIKRYVPFIDDYPGVSTPKRTKKESSALDMVFDPKYAGVFF